MAESGLPTLFYAAFRGSSNPMGLADADRRIVDVNGAILRLLGYSRDEVIGRFSYSFVHGDPAFSPQEWHAALRRGESESASEAELIRKDGSRVVVQWGITTEIVTGRYLALGVGIIKSPPRGRFRRPVEQTPAPSGRPLSPREREVVELVALGKTGPEIALELVLSHDTVRTHVRNAMEKVGARSRAQMVANALGEGAILISPPSGAVSNA